MKLFSFSLYIKNLTNTPIISDLRVLFGWGKILKSCRSCTLYRWDTLLSMSTWFHASQYFAGSRRDFSAYASGTLLNKTPRQTSLIWTRGTQMPLVPFHKSQRHSDHSMLTAECCAKIGNSIYHSIGSRYMLGVGSYITGHWFVSNTL